MGADLSEAARESVYNSFKPSFAKMNNEAPNLPAAESIQKTITLLKSQPNHGQNVNRNSYINHNRPIHHQTGISHPYSTNHHVLSPTTSALNLIGTLGLALVIGVIIYDFIAYLFAVYRNTADDYSPYGRRIATIASDIWTKRSLFNGLDSQLRGRSLEPYVGILDSLADAVKKWDDIPQKSIAKKKKKN